MIFEGTRAWSDRAMGGFGPVGADAPCAARPTPHAGLFVWAETALVGTLLLMLSSALLGPLGNPSGVGEPPAWLRLMWLPAYAVVGALMAARAQRMGSVWLAALVLLPIISWTVASAIWSLEPAITQRRSMALVFPTLFALFLAARYDWRSLVKIVAVISIILAVGSALAAVAVPSIGVDQKVHAGAWKGLFFEKNGMGGFMVRGALACLTVMTFSPRSWWVWLGGALLCAALVVMSNSTTALLGLLVVFGGFIAVSFLRLGPHFAVMGVWLAIAALIVVAAIFAAAPTFFFDLVGKDPSLTGRTNIWAAIMRQVAHQPWEGYGYGAFWRSQPTGPAAWVANEADWHVLAADNAWAEILVQLGWVGVSLFALTLVFMVPRAVAVLFGRGPAGYWAPLFLTTLLMTTITESVLLKQNDLTWVLYVATLAKLLQSSQTHAEMEARPWT